MPPSVLQFLGSSAISFMLSFMLIKAWQPLAPKLPSNVLLEVRLGLLQRLLVHRTQAMIVLAYILVGSLPVWESPWFLQGTQAAGLAGLAIVLMLPLRYVFTDSGIALNNGVPRTYRSFRRYLVRPGRRYLKDTTTVVLQGRRLPRGTNSSMNLFVPTAEMPAVARLLKRYVR